MSSVCMLMLVWALTVQYCHANCDSKILEDIKNLREGKEDTNVLDMLVGEYEIIYVDFGLVNLLMRYRCFKTTITKDDTGYGVVYYGLLTLRFKITYENGAIQVINDKGETTDVAYVVYNDMENAKVMAVYSCKPTIFFSVTFSAVIVPIPRVEGVADSVRAAQEALASVGIVGTTTSCSLEGK